MSANVDFDVYEIEEKPEFKRLNQAIVNCFEFMYKLGLNEFEALGVLHKSVGIVYSEKYAREYTEQNISSTSNSSIFGDMIKCINKILSKETTNYRNEE